VPSTSPARDAWRGEGWWAPASFRSAHGLSQIIGGLVVLALNHTDSEVPYSPSLTVPLLIKHSCFIRYLVADLCRWSLPSLSVVGLCVGRCRKSLPLVAAVGLCRWSRALVSVAGLCRCSLTSVSIKGVYRWSLLLSQSLLSAVSLCRWFLTVSVVSLCRWSLSLVSASVALVSL
jgi:hypothetical protein